MLGPIPIDLYSHRRVPMHQYAHHPGAFMLPMSTMHMSAAGSFPAFSSMIDPSNSAATHLEHGKYGGSFFDPFGNGMFLASHHHPPSAFFPISNSLQTSCSNYSSPPETNSNNLPGFPPALISGNASVISSSRTSASTPSAFVPGKGSVKVDLEQNRQAKEDEVTSSAEDTVPVTIKPQPLTRLSPSSGASDRDALFESAAKLLFLAVKWAKSMPSFTQIPLGDQTLLLEESWSELFIITAAQHGLAVDSEQITVFFLLKRFLIQLDFRYSHDN